MNKKILVWLVIFLGVAYGLWPADIIPDVPIVGWVDDIGVIGTVVFIVFKLLSKKPQVPEKNSKT